MVFGIMNVKLFEDTKNQKKTRSKLGEFFFLLGDVFDSVELHDVFDELFFGDWLGEEVTLNHLSAEGEDEVLLLLGLNAFLDGTEAKSVHRLIDV